MLVYVRTFGLAQFGIEVPFVVLDAVLKDPKVPTENETFSKAIRIPIWPNFNPSAVE